MMPPRCRVCDAEPTQNSMTDFGTLAFADYQPLPEGMTGHPDGLLWLCSHHLSLAKKWVHLNSAEAIEHLRRS